MKIQKNQVNVIIFDFDGVIVDSLKPLFLTWKKIAEEFDSKVKISDIEKYKKMFKNSVIKMLESIGLSKKESNRSIEIYLETLEKDPPILFKGIKTVLNKLSKNNTLVLVSGSLEEVIKKRLKEEGILGLFDIIIPMIKLERNKPDPYHINLAIKKLKTNPKDIIYVGDTVEDIQAARNAGISKIIGVSYGFGSKNSLKSENPSKIVDSPEEIIKVINKLKKK